MTTDDLQRELRDIVRWLDTGSRFPPGASFRDRPLTPARRRLATMRLRRIADKLERDT